MKPYSKTYMVTFTNPNVVKMLEEMKHNYNFRKKVIDKIEDEITEVEIIKGAVVEHIDLRYGPQLIEDKTDLEKIKKYFRNGSLSGPGKINNRFRELCKEIDITQTELSIMTNIPKSSLSQIMKNQSQPGLDYFFRIWVELGCPALDKTIYRA